MHHKLAEQEHAIDRYLLDEFTPEERMEFEDHLFDCSICADQVRRNAIAIDNVKQVLREQERETAKGTDKAETPSERSWFKWFRLPTLVPTFAALAFAAVLGYQNLVLIPALESPQVLSTKVIAPLARDGGPVITVDRNLTRFNLNFEVDAPRAYPLYDCEFQTDIGKTVLRVQSGPRQVASFTLDLLVPAKRFPAGQYTMILRAASEPQTEIQRYTFLIRDGGFGQ